MSCKQLIKNRKLFYSTFKFLCPLLTMNKKMSIFVLKIPKTVHTVLAVNERMCKYFWLNMILIAILSLLSPISFPFYLCIASRHLKKDGVSSTNTARKNKAFKKFYSARVRLGALRQNPICWVCAARQTGDTLSAERSTTH